MDARSLWFGCVGWDSQIRCQIVESVEHSMQWPSRWINVEVLQVVCKSNLIDCTGRPDKPFLQMKIIWKSRVSKKTFENPFEHHIKSHQISQKQQFAFVPDRFRTVRCRTLRVALLCLWWWLSWGTSLAGRTWMEMEYMDWNFKI